MYDGFALEEFEEMLGLLALSYTDLRSGGEKERGRGGGEYVRSVREGEGVCEECERWSERKGEGGGRECV